MRLEQEVRSDNKLLIGLYKSIFLEAYYAKMSYKE